MTDLMKKALSIFVVVIVITFTLGVIYMVKGKADKQVGEAMGTFDAAELSKYTDYDGRNDITGATVYNFIKDRENHSDGFYIEVDNVSYVYAKSQDGSGAKLAKSAEQALIKNANTRGNSGYINQHATYSATCNYYGSAGNEVFVGITFTKN